MRFCVTNVTEKNSVHALYKQICCVQPNFDLLRNEDDRGIIYFPHSGERLQNTNSAITFV